MGLVEIETQTHAQRKGLEAAQAKAEAGVGIDAKTAGNPPQWPQKKKKT